MADNAITRLLSPSPRAVEIEAARTKIVPADAPDTGSAPGADFNARIAPPARRDAPRAVTPGDAFGLSMVYRSIVIHAVSAKQLGLQQFRRNMVTDDKTRIPTDTFVRKPSVDSRRSAFIEETVVSLASRGNAYWRKFLDPLGRVYALRVLNPLHCFVHSGNPESKRYSYKGEFFPANEIEHLKLLRVPGEDYGLGPIQASQLELRGALDLQDYSSNWFRDGGIPTGVLSTDLPLSPDNADAAKARMMETQGGKRGPLVLGGGFKFSNVFLTPEEALFIEAQQFTTTQIARMFGTPASLMLAAVEGGSQTYANIEQDWLGFVRFSSTQYLIEIEEALSDCLPYGQEVRFNVEAFLRTDSTTRYSNYQKAVGVWMLDDEARALEGMDPLTTAQRDRLQKTPATAEPKESVE